MDIRKVRREAAEYLLMAALAVVFALNYLLFISRNGFAPAGVNGIATMVEYKTGFSVGYFSLMINIPLGIFAFFFVDKNFAVKTLVFSAVYSLSLLLFGLADLSAFQYDAQGVDTVFPALIAGSVGGFVYGLSVRCNASTGGVDIIAKYVSKVDPLVNFFWINQHRYI